MTSEKDPTIVYARIPSTLFKGTYDRTGNYGLLPEGMEIYPEQLAHTSNNTCNPSGRPRNLAIYQQIPGTSYTHRGRSTYRDKSASVDCTSPSSNYSAMPPMDIEYQPLPSFPEAAHKQTTLVNPEKSSRWRNGQRRSAMGFTQKEEAIIQKEYKEVELQEITVTDTTNQKLREKEAHAIHDPSKPEGTARQKHHEQEQHTSRLTKKSLLEKFKPLNRLLHRNLSHQENIGRGR